MPALHEMNDTIMADLQGRIERAACGRIQSLKVRQDQGLLVLEGVARCFHDKQKAQEAAFSSLKYAGPVQNLIEVRF